MGFLQTIHGTKTQRPRSAGRPWLTAWHDLAGITYGIGPDYRRLPDVLSLMNRCHDAFTKEDWTAFQTAAREVSTLLNAPHRQAKAS
jgi:hypothetical protein